MESDGRTTMDEELRREHMVSYLREHRERFRCTYHVQRMALIGSLARNEQRPQCDLDLLVDIERGTPGIHQIKNEMRAELERTFRRRVEIASERYLRPYCRERILREAVYVQELAECARNARRGHQDRRLHAGTDDV